MALIPVGKMVRFGRLTGEVTGLNRTGTRYIVLSSNGRSYTVPTGMAELLEDQAGAKPTDSIPTIRTFRIGDKVITYSPGSKYHGIKGEIIKINTATVKFQPADGGLPISGPANLFRFQEA